MSESSSANVALCRLPPLIHSRILSFVADSYGSLAKARCVCRCLHQASSDWMLWQRLYVTQHTTVVNAAFVPQIPELLPWEFLVRKNRRGRVPCPFPGCHVNSRTFGSEFEMHFVSHFAPLFSAHPSPSNSNPNHAGHPGPNCKPSDALHAIAARHRSVYERLSRDLSLFLCSANPSLDDPLLRAPKQTRRRTRSTARLILGDDGDSDNDSDDDKPLELLMAAGRAGASHHRRSRPSESDHVCDVCQRAHASALDLCFHVAKKHSGHTDKKRRVECVQCGVQLFSRSAVYRHARKAHRRRSAFESSVHIVEL
eukprot:ANDGO_07710.mRNA.1 hypothetical protein